MSGDRLLDRSVYPDRKLFFADLARVMREEIADLAGRGCTYLQMDEVPIAVLCDPKNREIVKRRGEDPEELINDYIEAINESIKERPENMTVCVHLRRKLRIIVPRSGRCRSFSSDLGRRTPVMNYVEKVIYACGHPSRRSRAGRARAPQDEG
jgi:methionine synthase II (cobalamin-independent)